MVKCLEPPQGDNLRIYDTFVDLSLFPSQSKRTNEQTNKSLTFFRPQNGIQETAQGSHSGFLEVTSEGGGTRSLYICGEEGKNYPLSIISFSAQFLNIHVSPSPSFNFLRRGDVLSLIPDLYQNTGPMNRDLKNP